MYRESGVETRTIGSARKLNNKGLTPEGGIRRKNMKNRLLVLLAVVLTIIAMPAAAKGSDEKTAWSVDFSRAGHPNGVSVTNNSCWDAGDYLMFYSRSSSLKINFKLPQDQKNFDGYKLKVTDKGTNLKLDTNNTPAFPVFSPVTIMVNNNTVMKDININWVQDMLNAYDIGDFLRPGANTVIFLINPASATQYALREVDLIY